jgi:hypothetical protein
MPAERFWLFRAPCQNLIGRALRRTLLALAKENFPSNLADTNGYDRSTPKLSATRVPPLIYSVNELLGSLSIMASSRLSNLMPLALYMRSNVTPTALITSAPVNFGVFMI